MGKMKLLKLKTHRLKTYKKIQEQERMYYHEK